MAFCLVAPCSIHADQTFYVSPAGNDAWSGRIADPGASQSDGPFATLVRARQAIRDAKQANGGTLKEPVRILVRGGLYFLDSAFELAPEDSGTEAFPITYAACEGEEPILSGAIAVTGFEAGKDGVWSAQIPAGPPGASFPFRELWIQGEGQDDSQRRYRPNAGPFVVASLTEAPARATPSPHTRSQDEFRYYPADLGAWTRRAGVEFVVLHDWSASRLRVRELDEAQSIVRFTGYPMYRVGYWYKNDHNPYYVENVPEAFTAPGQWLIEPSTGLVRYRPLAGETCATTSAFAPRTIQLLRLQGDAGAGRFVEHVRFRGLHFAYTAWPLPDTGYTSRQGMIDLPSAVEATGARRCRFEGCTFAHLAAYALNLGAGCHDNVIAGNRFYDLGGGGIKVGLTDTAAQSPVLPAGNTIANNVISDGGIEHFSAHGIWVGIAERTHIHHNIVRRFLYSTISAGWCWNDTPTSCRETIIEFNHIHDAMMLLADGGGIYTLGRQPGTVLRGNLIHDVHRGPFAGRAPNNGIFFDEGSTEFLVEGNIIYATSADPIRFNRNKHEGHTWRDNSFGVPPEDPAFPKEAAARAGLEPAYQDLDAATPAVPPPPILAMTPAAPPPAAPAP